MMFEFLKLLLHRSTACSYRGATAVEGGCQLAPELCTIYQLSKSASSPSLGAVRHLLPMLPEKVTGTLLLTPVNTAVGLTTLAAICRAPYKLHFYVLFPCVVRMTKKGFNSDCLKQAVLRGCHRFVTSCPFTWSKHASFFQDGLKRLTGTGNWRARQYPCSYLCCSNISLN